MYCLGAWERHPSNLLGVAWPQHPCHYWERSMLASHVCNTLLMQQGLVTLLCRGVLNYLDCCMAASCNCLVGNCDMAQETHETTHRPLGLLGYYQTDLSAQQEVLCWPTQPAGPNSQVHVTFIFAVHGVTCNTGGHLPPASAPQHRLSRCSACGPCLCSSPASNASTSGSTCYALCKHRSRSTIRESG